MGAVRLFFTITEVAYLTAALAFAVYYASNRRGIRSVAIVLLTAGALSQTLFIGWRWLEGARPPLANMFETLVFFSLAIAVTCLVVELLYSPKIVAAAASVLALLAMAYANLFDWAIQPLMPALQNSLWLTIHVIFCFVSYAAFAESYAVLLTAALVGTLNAKKVRGEEADSALSSLVYRTIAFGFPFLTIGIITGSVWANVTWGRYWGWDPKETWSLITWVVYALFLHVRLLRGRLGVKPKSLPQVHAILSVLGFLFVLFTFLGVNYLLRGLHAYTD
jgi:cytochrome c-type biogenesis protein CcsB